MNRTSYTGQGRWVLHCWARWSSGVTLAEQTRLHGSFWRMHTAGKVRWTSTSHKRWRSRSQMGAWPSGWLPTHRHTWRAVWWLPFIHHLSEGSVRECSTAHPPFLLWGVLCRYCRHLCSIFGLPAPGVLCAFLSCVGQTFSLLRTLCSSWTSSLSEMFPLWASLCVGRRVCERLVGGRRPAANGTYCCIAGARLSGSLPAIWLKGFVWHFRGSLSYPSCLTLGLWSMCVSIWWVAERRPREP